VPVPLEARFSVAVPDCAPALLTFRPTLIALLVLPAARLVMEPLPLAPPEVRPRCVQAFLEAYRRNVGVTDGDCLARAAADAYVAHVDTRGNARLRHLEYTPCTFTVCEGNAVGVPY